MGNVSYWKKLRSALTVMSIFDVAKRRSRYSWQCTHVQTHQLERTHQIIVHMSVRDLDRSKAFFSRLGYTFNPTFSNESAALMIIAEGSINAMLMTEAFFNSFTSKKITNTGEGIEMWVCLTCESREEVDGLVAKAVAAGGAATGAAEDHCFMYAHGFEYLDGHTWQLNFMRSMRG